MKKGLLFLVLSLIMLLAEGQDRKAIVLDSSFMELDQDAELFTEVSTLDPQRAALLSAVFPGLGQIYNKQYWKVPLVITGMVTFGHFINYNNKVYHGLRNAAITSQRGINPYSTLISSQEGLVRNRDNFRRNRDFLIILGSAFYILQIVDAHVSAHLDEFNVNDDLSMQIKPSIQSTPLFSQVVGVSLALKFR